MANITFAQLDRTKDMHVKSLKSGLVLGFLCSPTFETEVLFCIDAKGNCYTTGERKKLPTFKGDWVPTFAIPDHAIFIGQYDPAKSNVF